MMWYILLITCEVDDFEGRQHIELNICHLVIL